LIAEPIKAAEKNVEYRIMNIDLRRIFLLLRFDISYSTLDFHFRARKIKAAMDSLPASAEPKTLRAYSSILIRCGGKVLRP
jgi:hypothetical protein